MIQSDLLQGHLLVGELIDGSVHDAVRALADFFDSLVAGGVVALNLKCVHFCSSFS